VAGRPAVLASTAGKGLPHTGIRFLYGGLSPGGDALLRQDIDLIAAGFSARDLDAGTAVQAEGWLRNPYGADNFDDQVFYRVVFLDAAGNALGSLRTMVAANNAWQAQYLDGLLPPATRKLRLEVASRHRRDASNDGMADDLVVRLRAAPAPVSPQITKLPMLQDTRPDAMTLLWETDGNRALHAVDWGRADPAENSLTHVETIEIDANHFVHRAVLAGLQVETRYRYRVRSGTAVSPTFTFRTAPRPDTPFAVAWWADNHANTPIVRQHIAHLMAKKADLLAVAGDIVNSGTQLSEWHDYWFKPLEYLQCAQTIPVLYARGNHEGENALPYAYSALPGNEAWFAFDYGNSRFIFLDTEAITTVAPEQLAWLQAELQRPETQQAAFRIVCFHKPPFANFWNGGGYNGEPFTRTDWVPLFAQHHVDFVICGHAHNYNRGLSNNVVYIVTGGGGGTLDTEYVAGWPLYTVSYSRYHYDLLSVAGNTLTWQVFDENNQLLDQYTRKSRVPVLAWSQPPAAANQVKLQLSGQPGLTYWLESSPDLATWTRIATNRLLAYGSGQATNAFPPTLPARFYRARVAE
jgi:predicted phosphodiesterase